jgi:hypothetical protein
MSVRGELRSSPFLEARLQKRKRLPIDAGQWQDPQVLPSVGTDLNIEQEPAIG